MKYSVLVLFEDAGLLGDRYIAFKEVKLKKT